MTARTHSRTYRLLVVLVAVLSVTAMMPGIVGAVAESENNDSRAEADSITLGEATTGSITASDDEDWFVFQAQRGQQIVVSSSRGTAEGGSHNVYLYRDTSFLTNVNVRAGETDEQLGETVQVTGTYYVRVFGDTGAYEFTATLVNPSDTEPNEVRADAIPITSGQQVSATLGVNDEDWFSFEAERGQEVSIQSTRSSALTGSHNIYIYRDTSFLTNNNFRSGETETFGETLQTNGTHYVRVFGDTGDYTFTMTLTDLGPGEPNEGRADATPITSGQQVSSELTAGDEDWYSFEAVRGEQVTVTSTRASSEDGSHNVYLYRGDNFLTNVNVRVGETDEQLGETIQVNGTHYVRIFGDEGDYSFTMTRAVDEETEPNEEAADATPLFENPREVPFTGLLSVGTDEDWYEVPVQTGETLTVAGSRSSGVTGFYAIYLYDGGTFLNSTNVGSGETDVVSTVAARDGDLLIRVFGNNPGEYQLDVDVDGTDYGFANDRFELNENIAQSTDLDLGVYSDLRIVDTDVDVFAVELEQGDTLAANIRFDDNSDDLSLVIQNSQGLTLAQSTSGSNIEELSFLVPETNTYYLRVTGSGSGNTVYQLAARVPTQVTLAPVPQSVLMTPQDSTRVDVTIGGATNGVSDYEFTIAVADTSIATIENVQIVGTTGDVTIAPGGGSATVNVSSASLTTGATATLARVTLNSSDTEGSTALTLVASGVTDSTGFDYIAQTANGTVRVASGPGDVTGNGNPATDTDGDGLYDDVNGDGQRTFTDVIELAFILGGSQDVAPFFDFDGSGDLTFGDVIELAFNL